MADRIEKIEATTKKTWQVVMAWVGGITALIGLFESLMGGISWLTNHHRHALQNREKIEFAASQRGQKQYQAALRTYQEILKDDPLNQTAHDAELDTAMTWVEEFSLYVQEGKEEADLAASALDEILPVLSSGLAEQKGTRLADLEAHLGWAHFLNAKMAQRENDSVAVGDWNLAMATDPTNVYAHAMLGNWMLETRGDLSQVVNHFQTAIRSGRARPFVRRLELGGLLDLEMPGARAEIMRVANEMRTAGEVLDPELKRRIAGWCFDPVVNDHKQIAEVLGAVSKSDAWQTYLWLRADSGPDDNRDLERRFIHANLLEVSGESDAALQEYRELMQTLGDRQGSIRTQIEAAIGRLTHRPRAS